MLLLRTHVDKVCDVMRCSCVISGRWPDVSAKHSLFCNPKWFQVKFFHRVKSAYVLAPVARRIFDYVVLKLCKVHLNNFSSQSMDKILVCLYSLRSMNPWFRSSWVYFLKWSFIQFLSVYDICRMVYTNLFFRKEYVLKNSFGWIFHKLSYVNIKCI